MSNITLGPAFKYILYGNIIIYTTRVVYGFFQQQYQKVYNYTKKYMTFFFVFIILFDVI